VFGSTIKLIGSEFGKFGVESSFVSQTDVSEWKAAIKPNTRLLFGETPTNPLADVCDIRALADIAHNAGALLAVDTHGRLAEQQRLAAGIRQNLVRVAVGLEHLDDLKADLLRGLDTLN
jgi:cystathionine beta-lyase/cystathionine gamma-synthase